MENHLEVSTSNDSPSSVFLIGPAPAPLRALDLVCSVAFAVLFGLAAAMSFGGGTRSVLVADLSGFMFLVAAASYRGSMSTWWRWLMPTSFILLIGPLAIWEATGVIKGTGDLLRAIFIPGLSYLGGSLIASLRDTLRRSHEAKSAIGDLKSKLIANAFDLKRLGGEMTDIFDWMGQGTKTARAVSSVNNTSWDAVEYKLDPHALTEIGPSEWLTHERLQELLMAEMDRLSAEIVKRPKIKLSFISPREVPVPLAVKGQVDTLRAVLHGLLAQALDSMIADEGVIRVGLRPGLRSVSITIEDNGRGLNEAFLLKLQEKGVLARSSDRWDIKRIRRAAEVSGWRFEMLARLGVGARVTLEMPRVDAFALGANTPERPRIRIESDVNDARSMV